MAGEKVGGVRTAEATLRVVGPDGKARSDKEIELRQTAHGFLFGTAGFDVLISLIAEGEAKELSERKVGLITGIFNAATLPFYWGRFEPEKGKPRTAELAKTARRCAELGLMTKGHPLCWHTVCADWLLGLKDEEILQAQLDRIDRDVRDFRGLVDSWDVINEAVIMPNFDKYDNGVTRICRMKGRIGLIRAVFDAARKANPGATLFINDFDMSPAYDILVEGCLEAGIKIDAIGLQSHMHQGYWGAEKTLSILERFSRFGIPLHFTETTIVSGDLMPEEIDDLNDFKAAEWPSTPEGEERQARETITHYETLFSHPAVQGITWWSFSDGMWLNAPAGLVRKDGSPKPVYEELKKRIRGEWWTHPLKLRTDAEGKARFRGFLGSYELKSGDERASFKLTAPGEASVEVKL
jgi:endo-1,4-beta-xylanase